MLHQKIDNCLTSLLTWNDTVKQFTFKEEGEGSDDSDDEENSNNDVPLDSEDEDEGEGEGIPGIDGEEGENLGSTMVNVESID